jgi:hypothetical protein
MKGTGLWFVTPAWGRFEIVAVCLEQRRRVIEELAKHGIEAHQVVIADDENLDIARAAGADVIERDNQYLGRRWNDGTEYAAAKGAEWFVQIGSDSWIATDYFLPLTGPGITLTSPAYCAVTPDRMAQLWVSPKRIEHSAGPYVFHRQLLAPCGFRPTEETDNKGTDTSTVQGIEAHRPIRWGSRTVHPFQYVGFRVSPLMTTYKALWKRWGVAEHEPWGTLAKYYPRDLVDRARKAMARG